MILVINTSQSKTAQLALCCGEDCEIKNINVDKSQSENLLPALDKLLRSKDISLRDLRAVAVCEGPGSFTGLRIGITVANILAWVLDIPVVGFKKEEPAAAAKIARASIRRRPGFHKPVVSKYPS